MNSPQYLFLNYKPIINLKMAKKQNIKPTEQVIENTTTPVEPITEITMIEKYQEVKINQLQYVLFLMDPMKIWVLKIMVCHFLKV